jgi:hypothetical protein
MVTRIFLNPVAGPWTQSDPFGARNGTHYGDDLACKVGTPIIATAAGTVVYAGISGGYGNLIEINHADGAQSRYGHMSKINVTIGEKVTQGEQVGLSGGSKGAFGAGDSTGPHLHFEIRLNGKPVDPGPLIGGYGASTDTPSQTGVNAPNTGLGGWAAGLDTITSKLADPKFWTRVGLVVIGSILILIAASKIFATTEAGKAASSALKTVATTAAIL